jgi:putative ABC transport system permease protein
MVLNEGTRLMAPGMVIGLVAALVSARVLNNLLFDVSTLDPLTYLAVAGILTLVCLAATYAPALRATRVDPITSMRSE